MAPLLVAVVKHTGAGFNFRMKAKGSDPVAVAACLRFLFEQGLYVTIRFKTDPEIAVMCFAKALARARALRTPSC